MNNLALWLCPILSPKAMADYKDKIGMHPVGTGPFKFVSWTKDDQIVLERNNDYWGDKAKVSKIILKSIPEPSARLMALQSGTVDIADDLDPDSIALVKKNPKLAVIERPSVNVGYLAFNTQKPRLKDPKVRQALNHAVDKDTLIKSIFAGLAIPAKNPFPPSIWSYNNAIKPYDYNPEKAKKMLTEAGFDFNTEIELWAMPVSRAYMPEPVKTAELIQAYFAAVGVKAKIVRQEWGAYLAKTSNGEDDMCMLGWLGGNADPDNFLYGLLSADTAKTAGCLQRGPLEERRVHRAVPEGPEDLQQGRAHQALPQGPGDLSRRGALAAPGAFHHRALLQQEIARRAAAAERTQLVPDDLERKVTTWEVLISASARRPAVTAAYR